MALQRIKSSFNWWFFVMLRLRHSKSTPIITTNKRPKINNFDNLHNIIRLELLIGQPLMNKARIYIREDEARDSLYQPVKIIMFNDIIIIVNKEVIIIEYSKMELAETPVLAINNVDIHFEGLLTRLNFLNTLKAIMDSHVNRTKEFKWISDDQELNCMICRVGFTIFNRRHHCRECGKLICHGCSEFTQNAKRLCLNCYF
jgi:hypothetical protein